MLCEVLGSSRQKRQETTREGSGRAMEVIKKLGYLSSEERLRTLGLYSMERSRLRGDLTNACKYLKDGCQVSGAKLFSRAQREDHGAMGTN